MFARVSTIQGSPDLLDATIAHIKESSIPSIKGMDGYERSVFLADRETGKIVAIAFWATREALDASEAAVQKTREEAASSAGGSIASVDRFEVVAEA